MIVFISYTTIAMLGIYITLYQYTVLSMTQLFLLNTTMMGLLIGMQHFGMSVPPLFLGVLCANIGKKKVILISYLLIISGTFLVGVTQSFISFIISVFIIGAGFSVSEATLSAVLADEFPGESTRHLNFSQVAFSVGALAGPFVAAALINNGVYFKDLYIYCSAAFLILGIIFLFTKHQNDKGKGNEETQNGSYYLKTFFRNKAFLFLGIGVFLYVGIENTFANYTDSYYELVIQAPELSAIALALFWGAMIPSRFLAGVIKTNMKKMFILMCVLVFTAAIAAILIPDNTVKIVMFMICGFGCGPIWPLMMDTVAKKNIGSTGPSMNIMMSFSALGGAALPLVSGFLVNGTSQASAYYLCAIATIFMLWVYLKSLKRNTLT